MGQTLVTASDEEPVYSDGKGNFSLERNDVFQMAAEFVKMLRGDDAEAYRAKASQQLGIELQYEKY
jgi:hypothetical protein